MPCNFFQLPPDGATLILFLHERKLRKYDRQGKKKNRGRKDREGKEKREKVRAMLSRKEEDLGELGGRRLGDGGNFKTDVLLL